MAVQDSTTRRETRTSDGPPPRFPFPPPPTLYHPAPEIAALRAEGPAAPVTLPDGSTAWLVTRFAEVRQVLVDPRFSRAAAAGATPTNGVEILAADSILGMDPPQHTRLRRLVASAFTARRVEALRPRVTELVDELLGAMADLPRPADLVAHFSLPLPVRVICELLGVPAADQHLFHGRSDTIMSNDAHDPARVRSATAKLAEYFQDLVAAKRARPTDDLLTALIAARDEQDRLTEHELVRLGFGLLIAGHETTANQINMFLLTLLRHPDELARLRAAPESIPQAVEELMRFVQLGEGSAALPRVTTADVDLGGVTIPADSLVLPGVGGANRDPGMYADPDRLDLARPAAGDQPFQHLGFGAGAHHCLGAQLARMELQEALRGLLRHMPGIRVPVPDDQLSFKQGMLLRSLDTLPVTW